MTEFSSETIFKNESFQNEDSNLHWQEEYPINSNDTERKCGEIILLANSKFWFLCSFCDERFHSIVIFRNHIKGIHITGSNNVPFTEDENPLDVPPNENQIIVKCETDITNDNYNDHFEEPSDDLISKSDFKKINEKFKFEYDKPIEDCSYDFKDSVNHQSDSDELEEIIPTQTNKVSDISIKKYDCIQSISEVIDEKVRSNKKNTTLICKDMEHLLPAPKKIPKKRNRKKKVYSCPTCQQITRDQKSLEAHLQSIHGTGTRHQCEECGKCFRNGNNLRAHLLIHSGTRPFKCDFCDSDFTHYNSLKLHRFIHTGERPHKCNQCDKGFVSSSGLKTHLREHTGEIPYVCQFCERGFASQCSYKRHMISHSGRRAHECPICKRAFIHKETLTKHMACHSNEKKFVCSVCSKKFNHKKNLVQHEKLHLNIKQYICKICSKDFAQYAGLYSHMKYHKNKD